MTHLNLNQNTADSKFSRTTHQTENAVPFQNVVISNVDGYAPSNELCTAAIRHVKTKVGGYIEILHDPKLVDELFNPDMFPMIYPTLFLYGISGFEDCDCSSKLSIKHQEWP